MLFESRLMDTLISELEQLDTQSAIFLLNSMARASLALQDSAIKIWFLLNLDLNRMCDGLFFYGIDKEYIPIKESFKRSGKLVLKLMTYKYSFPKNLIETRYEEDMRFLDPVFVESDWAIFRIKRRMNQNEQNVITYRFIYQDDVETLQTQIARNEIADEHRPYIMEEAILSGSINCFKFLILNTTVQDNTVLEYACCSGNHEIIQFLIEKGLKFNLKCLENAILHWNNDLAKWIIEEQNLNDIYYPLKAAILSGNYEMVNYYCYNKGFTFDKKDPVSIIFLLTMFA